MPAAITVKNLTKRFEMPLERHSSLKQLIIRGLWRRGKRDFHALNDVSFEVKQGEFFGVIGHNGSGKSTLLKILANIYLPTSGTVEVEGRLSPFIELGVGFNPELTARENVFLNGTILGLTRRELRERFDEIIAFAELEEFVDQRLKNFSSGMLVRLAFAVAIQAHSEILLVDEVLAVGDARFQQKCYDVFRRLKAEGTTVVFVSHDLSSIREFCDRVLLLNHGVVQGVFSPPQAILRYADLDRVRASKAIMRQENRERTADDHADTASSEAEPVATADELPDQLPTIEAIELLDADGAATRALKRGDAMSIRIGVANPGHVGMHAGVAIYRNDGLHCFATNTVLTDVDLGDDAALDVTLEIPALGLSRGSYHLAAGLFRKAGKGPYDLREHAIDFEVLQSDGFDGVVYLDHEWSVAPLVNAKR